MIKAFVFDTNVLISLYLSPTSIHRKAFEKVRELGMPVYSNSTLAEFSETLMRPKFDKYISQADRLDALYSYKRSSQLIDVSTSVNICRDPKDNKFLELAVESEATCIITGDKDLLVLHPFQGIPIVTSADFMLLF